MDKFEGLEKQEYKAIVCETGDFNRWLKKNKLYAHRASSFCDRNYSWYQKSFKEQLKNLCWEFDDNEKLSKTQW